MTTIDELLKNYRDVFCMSEKEKGECFERLMKNFLLTYPPFRGKFKNVWLWKNFPHKNQLGGKFILLKKFFHLIHLSIYSAPGKFNKFFISQKFIEVIIGNPPYSVG